MVKREQIVWPHPSLSQLFRWSQYSQKNRDLSGALVAAKKERSASESEAGQRKNGQLEGTAEVRLLSSSRVAASPLTEPCSSNWTNILYILPYNESTVEEDAGRWLVEQTLLCWSDCHATRRRDRPFLTPRGEAQFLGRYKLLRYSKESQHVDGSNNLHYNPIISLNNNISIDLKPEMAPTEDYWSAPQPNLPLNPCRCTAAA